jgi:hypothetical protein
MLNIKIVLAFTDLEEKKREKRGEGKERKKRE